VDGSVEDVLEAVREVDGELHAYGGGLESKPQILVVNKLDLPEVQAARQSLEKLLTSKDRVVRFISAAGATGVSEIMSEAAAAVERARLTEEPRVAPTVALEHRMRRLAPMVTRDDGTFVVDDTKAVSLVAGSDLREGAGRVQLKLMLNRLGVTAALDHAGVEMGDTVRFGEIELEW
jgi:GTP-binding protein